jgi:serine/threonine protein kinase
VSERDIFTATRTMTDPVARSAYLDGACGGDAGLRSRVEALLRAHDQPDSLLDHPAVVSHGPASQATLANGHEGGAATDGEVPLGFLAPATRPDSRGRIGHYNVLQVLGHGGFGIVFRAFDDVLHRVVAVKVLSPQMAATSPARKRFLREARSAAAVRHENVVQVYEVAEQPLPYLVMEFIPGETLQQKLDRTGPLDVPEVLRIGRQIAEGLAAAHDHDLIHRDIKPGNVLLESGPHGRAKITDFGLARAADDASISQSGLVAGTPMYMAPEQAQGQPLDHRADLFSLGSVLYQKISGRPPFRASTMVAVLKRVAEDQPRAIREIIPETPQWLCDIIAKLHAKNPDERFQSAREVADVLADCEAQLKANARLKDFSRIPRSEPRRPGRRRWVAAAAAVLMPVIALAVTEFAGVSHLVRGPRPVRDPDKAPTSDRGSAVGLRLARVPSGVPSPAAQSHTAAPDRRAAEYVLSIGGTVRVNEQPRLITVTADLPPGSFRLTAVRANTHQATDAGLAIFQECRNLTDLTLGGHAVSDKALAYFKDCKELRLLALYMPSCGDAAMAHFKDCKNLEILDLRDTKVGDAGLMNFRDCANLTTLYLGPLVGDEGLAHLRDCKNLKKVQIQWTRVSAVGLNYLKDMPLVQICLTPRNFTAHELAILRDMKSLKLIGIDRRPDESWPSAEFWQRYDKGEFK